MNQHLLIQTSEVLLFAAACIGLILVILASLYDLRTIARRRYFRSIVATSPKRNRPQVTVLVYAKDSSVTIEACLVSISRNNYKKYDIVVVDNVSADATKQAMTAYVKRRPTKPLYYYRKRKESGRLQALQSGYRKSRRGDIVLVLDADGTIPPGLIGEAAARFVADDTLLALRLNENLKDVRSSILLSLRFLHLSRNIYAKSTSLLSIGQINVDTQNVMYGGSVFMKHRYSKDLNKVPYRYDGELVVTTERLPRLGTVFGSVRIKGWLIAVLPVLFLITYFLYTAVTLQSNTLLVLSWSMLAIWLFAAVVSDEGSGVTEKISSLFYIPAVFFLFYVQLIFYSIVMIISLPGSMIIFGRKKQKYY